MSKEFELEQAGSMSKIEAAQQAFAEGNKEVSLFIHKQGVVRKEPHSGEAGEHISEIVFGGLDGIITTFAVVSAATASHLTRGVILIIGIANLLGDAIGMAVGDYVSTKAESEHIKAERAREQWEMEHCIEEEKEEMIEIYKKKGLTPEEAVEVVNILLENPKVFLDTMMVEELGLLKENQESVLKGAFITFGAFMVFGGLPMLAYLCAGSYSTPAGFDVVYGISIILFAIALFALGALKGRISKKKWYITGLTMLLNGSATTAVSYAIGDLLQEYVA